MPKEYKAPAPFADEAMPSIAMTPVESSQIAAIGYDPASKTLAVTFKRGTGAIYHYPNVEPKTHADFVAAESIGGFFGKHVKSLPFKKFANSAAGPVAFGEPNAAPATTLAASGQIAS